MSRPARALLRIVRLALSRDRLGTAPAPVVRRRRSLLASVFAHEALAEDAPAAPRPRRSLARLLLAPEPLPLDAPMPRARRGSWLRWLFARERLDPR